MSHSLKKINYDFLYKQKLQLNLDAKFAVYYTVKNSTASQFSPWQIMLILK